MQKFLSLLFSRRALAVVGVLVLALLVWFVGPLVSFDTLRPLASVGSRVASVHRPSGLFRAGRKIPGIKPAIMTVRLSWLPDSELGCGKISV